jgi:glycosyltransferase involved in cell wall biosynthesis
MKVVVDGQITSNDGIGRYTSCLQDSLRREGACNDLEFHVLPPSGIPRYSQAEGDHLLSEARRRDADVIHLLDYRVPLCDASVPVVATVHDIRLRDSAHCYSNEHFTDRYGPAHMALLVTAVRTLRETDPWPTGLSRKPSSWHEEFVGRMLCRTAATATAIMCPTRAVAAEFARVTATDRSVYVSPYGVDHLHSPKLNTKAHAVPSYRYLLYVGQARTHKGISGLLAAFARSGLAKEGARLALVGRDFAPGCSGTTDATSVDGVEAIGPVSDDELATWYCNAVALVHLSSHEGFGLTPVEAMRFGARTVAADIPVLREVLGQHAIYVDPQNVLQVAAVLRKLVHEPDDSKDRAARIAWARRYQWAEHARDVLAVYRRVSA